MTLRVHRRQLLAALACGTWFARQLTHNLRSAQAAEPPSPVTYDDPAKYRCTHRVEVTRRGAALTDLELWLPIPTDWPEQQVLDLQISPNAPCVTAIDGRTRVARWLITAPDELARNQISLEATYEIKRLRIVANREGLLSSSGLNYDDQSPDVRAARILEKHASQNLPAIAEVARKIRGHHRPWGRVALDLYDWVLDRTSYQLVDGFQGAEYCLQNQHGECGDYSALFVALCRAAGIPARANVGYWARGTNEYHVWAEFLLPSGHWVPVDPSIGDQSAEKRRQYFGGLDNNRVTLVKAFDVTLPTPAAGHSSVPFLQAGAWWWHGRGGAVDAKFSFTGDPV